MSTLKRADPKASERRPLYIKFDKALRTQKDNGVTLYDVEAKFGDGETFNFEGARVTLYDSHFGKPGHECALTNPCMVYMNSNGYWDVRPVDGKPVAFDSPKDAPMPEKKEWGGNGKGHDWTPRQLEAMYEYWQTFIGDRYTDDQARAYAIDGLCEIGSMACSPSDFSDDAEYPPAQEPPF